MSNNFSNSLKEQNEGLWTKVLSHPFIEEIGDLELPLSKFKIFIEQDYQYLLGFIRTLGLFLAKSPRLSEITKFRDMVNVNFEELKSLERSYEALGYSKGNLNDTEPFLATESYRSYLLLQGYEGTKFEILGVILPCDWVFADIGKKLEKRIPDSVENHFSIYVDWAESYASEEYQNSIQELRSEVDEKYKKASEKEREKFKKNFSLGLEFEHAFFESIYNRGETEL